MPVMVVPEGSRTTPRRSNSGSVDSRTWKTESKIADVDHLPAPLRIAVARAQREQHAERGVQSGERVAEREVGAHRHLARMAGQVAQAADRLADRGVARSVRVGPGLAEARDRGRRRVPGFDSAEPLGAEPPALERAGPEVLDQDVGAAREPARRARCPRCVAQVEVTTDLLAAPERAPPERGAVVVEQAPAADRIAPPGGSTLITSAPKSASSAPAKGPARMLPELEHPHAVERPRRGVHPISASARDPARPRAGRARRRPD